MRAWMMMGALLVMVACGGGTDGRDARDWADAGLGADASGADGGNAGDAGHTSSDAGASGIKDAGSGGKAPGQCAPGNACGGLQRCTDYCYGDRCCLLDCSCSAQDTLACQLVCN